MGQTQWVRLNSRLELHLSSFTFKTAYVSLVQQAVETTLQVSKLVMERNRGRGTGTDTFAVKSLEHEKEDITDIKCTFMCNMHY